MQLSRGQSNQSGSAWDALHPWVRAALVGAASLALSLVIYWALWRFWVVQPSRNPADDLALQLLFGVTVAAFSTVLLAGVLGYRAHSESGVSRAANGHPFRIVVDTIDDGERASSLLGAKPVRLGFTLVNTSDHLESWFRIRLDLPILAPVWSEFGPSDDDIDRALFLAWAIPQRLNDDTERWRLSFRQVDDEWNIAAHYQSLGEAAVFPQSQTLLCTLAIPTEHFRPGQTIACRYRLESAHAAPLEETLLVRM